MFEQHKNEPRNIMKVISLRPKQLVLIIAAATASIVFFVFFLKDDGIREEPYSTDINSREFVPSESSLDRVNNLTKGSDQSKTGDTKNVQIEGEDIITVAKRVASHNRTVLVTMVNDAYLSFTYSWLCNTKDMDVHKSVLIITTDQASKTRLERDWPEISVVAMKMNNSGGDQVYSHAGYVKIMVTRTEMLLSILMADIEIFLFEVDCLWFANPTPKLQKYTNVDILVNPVSGTNNVYAGGFLYLFTTSKAKALWKKVTEMMVNLGERLSAMDNNQSISEGDNDQQYLSRLLNEK